MRLELEFADGQTRARSTSVHRARFEDGALHPIDSPAAHRERVDAVAELDGDKAAGRRLANAPLKGRHDSRARPPCHVEAGHGIPRATRYGAPSLRPADDREEVHSLRAQPRPFLAGGEGDIGLGPFARPVVFGPIESGRDHPVLFRPLLRVANPKPALLRGVDEKEAAERPEGLPAQPRCGLLFEQDHAAARLRELRRGDQSGEAGADDDDVRAVTHSDRQADADW